MLKSGKACYWIVIDNEHTEYHDCENLNEALDIVVQAIKDNPEISIGVINYKREDEIAIDAIRIERRVLPKQESWIEKLKNCLGLKSGT